MSCIFAFSFVYSTQLGVAVFPQPTVLPCAWLSLLVELAFIPRGHLSLLQGILDIQWDETLPSRHAEIGSSQASIDQLLSNQDN